MRFTNEQCEKIIIYKNEDFKKQFDAAANNPYKINDVWVELTKKLFGEEKFLEDQKLVTKTKQRYNDMIREFRTKKREAIKSGAGGGQRYKYAHILENYALASTKVVPDNCLDPLNSSTSAHIPSSVCTEKKTRRKK